MLHLAGKILYLCAFVGYYAKAETEEQLKQIFVDILLKCSEDFPPTPAEIELLKNKKLADSTNMKCMFACTYKKTGMMNEKGEISVEGINNLSKKYFANNPEKTKKALAYADACKSVNDVKVSDGEKGCERAALMFKCTIEKAAEFDLID
uniref:Odorant binding protein 15 n=1 Tax=Conogethes pinicolalis TaxID=1178461 RepID=A0A5B9G9X4_9NEOP|nr:odorant binding protein 15 [Conogethes pinicolalis]